MRFGRSLDFQTEPGLSQIEKRIKIFSNIRNIPYAIIPQWRESADIIPLMITENRGWCGPKHSLLTWMLTRLGIKTVLVTIPFRWQEQPVNYPDSLRTIMTSLPDTSHLCCKAYLNDAWIILDATWDPLLKNAGFPINDPWDGISGTIPAVTRFTMTIQKPDIIPSPLELMHRAQFFENLNQWLEEIRHNDSSVVNQSIKFE